MSGYVMRSDLQDCVVRSEREIFRRPLGSIAPDGKRVSRSLLDPASNLTVPKPKPPTELGQSDCT